MWWRLIGRRRSSRVPPRLRPARHALRHRRRHECAPAAPSRRSALRRHSVRPPESGCCRDSPGLLRYGDSSAAVSPSRTPSRKILTASAFSRGPDTSCRRASRSSNFSVPPVFGYSSERRTLAVSAPLRATSSKASNSALLTDASMNDVIPYVLTSRNPRLRPSSCILRAGLRGLGQDQVNGGFAKRAARLTRARVALDYPVLGIRRARIDSSELECTRTRPRAVRVNAVQDYCPARYGLIEQFLARAAVIEQRHPPSTADDPFVPRLAGARPDRVEDLLDGHQVIDRALQLFESGRGDVDMRVVKARQRHAVGEIDDLGRFALERQDLLVAANRHDASIAHRRSLRPGALWRRRCRCHR